MLFIIQVLASISLSVPLGAPCCSQSPSRPISMPSKRPICFCYGTGCSVHPSSQSASTVELAANAHPEANGLVDLDLNVLHYLGSGIYIFVPSKSTMLWPTSFSSNQQAKHYGIGCKLQAYIQIANPLLLWDWLQVYIQKLKD